MVDLKISRHPPAEGDVREDHVVGDGVDGSVLRIETAYDDAGRPYLFTSYDAADGGAVVNQVSRSYDGLGRLVSEWQEHDGPVTADTPHVGYAYGEMAGGNHSRPVSVTYPSGWVLGYDYGGGVDGIDARVSRLSGITETRGGTQAPLESLDYLGLNTLVGRRYAEAGIGLVYYAAPHAPHAPGGDHYAGLDRFGRVIDHRWADVSGGGGGGGGDVDRFGYGYGYDRDGNRLYRDNALSPSHSELYHGGGAGGVGGGGYDGLGRMTAFSRGTLNPAKEGLAGTASRTQGWSLDALGNWDASSTDGVTETRLHDRENRVQTANGTGDATGERFTHTDNGETVQTYFVPDGAGGGGDVFTYDAWGRLALFAADVVTTGPDGRTWEATGGETRFAHDALGRRVAVGDRVHVYSKDWQVLEERDAAPTAPTAPTAGAGYDTRYVWSPAYVDAMVLRDRLSPDTTGGGLPGGGGGGDERLYVLQDANYNVTAVVAERPDGTWAAAERYQHDPYGGNRVVLDGDWQEKPAGGGGAGGGYAFEHGHQGGRHWRYTSHPADTLVHFRHRDLSTRTGRWMRQDPAGYVDGGNLYQAFRASPVSLVDPLGLRPLDLYETDPAGNPLPDIPYHSSDDRGGAYTQQERRQQRRRLNPMYLLAGARNYAYTSRFNPTQEELDAAYDAAGEWLYHRSAIRGVYGRVEGTGTVGGRDKYSGGVAGAADLDGTTKGGIVFSATPSGAPGSVGVTIDGDGVITPSVKNVGPVTIRVNKAGTMQLGVNGTIGSIKIEGGFGIDTDNIRGHLDDLRDSLGL